jgi:UDP-N-acetylmuramate dehydrogenase
MAKTYPDMPQYPSGEGMVKLAAGWLIEKCGWKGYRTGDAGVHDKQALVLVNHGNATGSDIFKLSDQIRQSVLQRFGVSLEREVEVI